MKHAKILFLTLFSLSLVISNQLFATDCSVGYAHMKNGKYKQAYKEFRGLAERGYAFYMDKIGDMHQKGQGVPASNAMAYVWYSLSAAQGDPEGIRNQKMLANKLTAKQLADIQPLIKEYKQNYLEPYVASWALKDKQ